jgi:hypothetical protein
MKNLELNPLDLDKETIALLDGKQLQDVLGGANQNVQIVRFGTSTGCGSGSSTCGVVAQ